MQKNTNLRTSNPDMRYTLGTNLQRTLWHGRNVLKNSYQFQPREKNTMGHDKVNRNNSNVDVRVPTGITGLSILIDTSYSLILSKINYLKILHTLINM